MAKFKIEKGIALPPARDVPAYPFQEMSISDSFFVPVTEKYDQDKTLARLLSNSQHNSKKNPNYKFRCRRWTQVVKDDKGKEVEVLGARCWRIDGNGKPNGKG